MANFQKRMQKIIFTFICIPFHYGQSVKQVIVFYFIQIYQTLDKIFSCDSGGKLQFIAINKSWMIVLIILPVH